MHRIDEKDRHIDREIDRQTDGQNNIHTSR